jgi:hypothetical protein
MDTHISPSLRLAAPATDQLVKHHCGEQEAGHAHLPFFEAGCSCKQISLLGTTVVNTRLDTHIFPSLRLAAPANRSAD